MNLLSPLYRTLRRTVLLPGMWWGTRGMVVRGHGRLVHAPRGAPSAANVSTDPTGLCLRELAQGDPGERTSITLFPHCNPTVAPLGPCCGTSRTLFWVKLVLFRVKLALFGVKLALFGVKLTVLSGNLLNFTEFTGKSRKCHCFDA